MIEAQLTQFPDEPDPARFLAALHQTFEALGESGAYQAGMRRSVPGVEQLYAVRVPQLRQLARELLVKYGRMPGTMRSLGLAAWEGGSREHQLLALFLLDGGRLSPAERWALSEQFLPAVGNWESCDQLCLALSGRALAEDPSCMEHVEDWARSDNFWVRRAALVSTVYLRRARFSEDRRLELDRRVLAICRALLTDEEAYIRKAVDWAIREVIKRSYSLAHAWMQCQVGGGASPLARSTLRKAARKLNAADRQAILAALD